MGYSNSGPFTDNTVPPGISANFLNNIENYLDTINSAATDGSISANGSGALTAVSATFTAAGTGLTVQHNALVSGNLTLTGTLTEAGAATFNGAGTGLTVAHNATISGTLTSPTYGGNPTFTGSPQVNGTLNLNSALNLVNGSITAITFGFIATLTSSGVTITHNLGGTPGFVGGQILAGTGNLGAVVTYITSVNSSSFVISSSSVSGFAAYWIALR